MLRSLPQEFGKEGENPALTLAFPDELLPTLRAALNRMVPPDQDPGGADLGGVEYVLAFAERDADVRELYIEGLTGLRSEGFETMDADAQDRLLREVERMERRPGWMVRPSIFMAMLARHAIEAAYTNPGGWKIAGFEVTA